jgi:hypothetical protein
MGYEWPPWTLDGLRGIGPSEVIQALGAARRWPRGARSQNGVAVLTIWARTRSGRPLVVAVRRSDEWTWLIVGARDMSLPERAEFARWEGASDG